MDTMEELKGRWNESKVVVGSEDHLSDAAMLQVIQSRVKKEKNVVGSYMISSWAWQFIVYAFSVNLIVRFWDNWKLVVAGFAGLVLYIPFTAMYAKFCSQSLKELGKRKDTLKSIGDDLQLQYIRLNEFFTFKKRFDLIGIPVIGLIIVSIFSSLNMIPSILDKPIPGLTLLVIILIPFIAATYAENRKRFISPLGKLKGMLNEMEHSA